MGTARGPSHEVLDRLIQALEELVRSTLRRVASVFARNVRGMPSPAAVNPADDSAAVILPLWATAVTTELVPAVAYTWEQAASTLARDFTQAGIPNVLPLGPDRAAAYLENAANRLVGIGDIVWSEIRDQLAEGVTAGEGIPELAKRVMTGADMSEARATLIARTEVISASNAGSFAQALALGDPTMTKTWQATPDDRTRIDHRVADGQTQPLAEPFEVGGFPLMFPGDPAGPPGEVINCRCVPTYGFDDDEVVTAAWDVIVADGNYDPSLHPHDRLGRFADKPGSGAVASVLDKLKLAGKIDLAPGETLVGSGKVESDDFGARFALTTGDAGPRLRLGLGGEGFGQRNADDGIPVWSGNNDTARINAERKVLRDELERLELEPESTPEREAQIAARVAEIEDLDYQEIHDNGATAILDDAGMDRLRDLEPAIAQAEKLDREDNAYWDRVDAEKAKLVAERKQLVADMNHMDATIESPWTDAQKAEYQVKLARTQDLHGEIKDFDRVAQAGAPIQDYMVFGEGVIPGADWGDVHWRVEVDEDVSVLAGVKPRDAGDDWSVGGDDAAGFDPAEWRKFMRQVEKLRASQGEVVTADGWLVLVADYDSEHHIKRDSHGQFAHTPGEKLVAALKDAVGGTGDDHSAYFDDGRYIDMSSVGEDDDGNPIITVEVGNNDEAVQVDLNGTEAQTLLSAASATLLAPPDPDVTTSKGRLQALLARSSRGVMFDDGRYFDWSSRTPDGGYRLEAGTEDEAVQLELSPAEFERWVLSLGDVMIDHGAMTASVLVAAAEHSGAMIALAPCVDDCYRLEVDGGEPAEQLHATLVYLGDDDQLSGAQRLAILDACAQLAGGMGPIELDAFAVSAFNPTNEDRDTAVVLGLGGEEGPGLAALQQQALGVAMEALGDILPPPREPWVAHLTLEYTDDLSKVEEYADRTGPVLFDHLRVAFGGDVFDLPLSTCGCGVDALTAAAGPDFEAKHRRGPGGRFVKMGDRMADAVGSGKGLGEFNRAQLLKVAREEGVKLGRGEPDDAVRAKLTDHFGGTGKAPSVPEPAPAPKKAAKPRAPRKAAKKAAPVVPAFKDLGPEEQNKTLEDAYREISAKTGSKYVGFDDLRDRMPGLDRDEQDEVLKRFLRSSPDIDAIPESNQKALTPKERADALFYGGQNKHYLFIEPSGGPEPTREVPAPPKKRAPRKTPPKEALPGTVTGNDALDAAPMSMIRPAEPSQRLSREQERYLDDYKNLSYAINDVLREGQGSLPTDGTSINEYNHDQAREMDAAMDRSPLARDVTVWRGIKRGRTVFGDAWDGDLAGGEWTEHGYLSTSAAEWAGAEFGEALGRRDGAVMRIRLPEGTKAITVSGADDESEILAQRGLRLRVVSDTKGADGIRRLDVEVVPTIQTDTGGRITQDEAARIMHGPSGKPAPKKRAPRKAAVKKATPPAPPKPAEPAPSAASYTGPEFELPAGVTQADYDQFRDMAGKVDRRETDVDLDKFGDLRDKLPKVVQDRAIQEARVDRNFDEWSARNHPGRDPDEVHAEMAAAAKEAFAGRKVAVRVTPQGLTKLLDDGRFKTFYEHGHSESADPASRPGAEAAMFGLGPDTDPTVRPIYGYVMGDDEKAGEAGMGPGSDALSQYGRIQVVLKPETTRSRTTAMFGDSLDNGQFGRPSPIDDPDWRSYTPSNGGIIGRFYSGTDRDVSSPDARPWTYTEAQIHGGVTVDDIAEVILPPDASDALKARLDKAGVPWRVPGESIHPAPAEAEPSAPGLFALGEPDSARLLGGGVSADVNLMTFGDGTVIVQKVYGRRVPGTEAEIKHELDAEELGAMVLRAVGGSAPRVEREGRTLRFNHVDGQVGTEFTPWGGTPDPSIADSDDGRLIGVADVVMGNMDRNDGNWIRTPDGRIVGIDHGQAFYYDELARSPFAQYLGHYADGSDEPSIRTEGIDLHPDDAAQIMEALAALEPEFKARRRISWHTQMMRIMRQIEAGATGERRRLP